MVLKKSFKTRWYILAVILSFAGLFATLYYENIFDYRSAITASVQDEILEMEEHRNDKLKVISELIKDLPADSVFEHLQQRADLSEITFGMFVFKDNDLIYWTDNSIPIATSFEKGDWKNNLMFLENGWYQVSKYQSGDFTLIGCDLIFREYSHENQYLTNGFPERLNNSALVALDTTESESGPEVVDSAGNYLFTPIFKEGFQFFQNRDLFVTLLIILFVFFSLKTIERLFIGSNVTHKNWKVYLLIFFILLGRYLMISGKFPDILYQTDLFNSINYAYSFVFSSIGDLILNALVALYIVYLFNKFLLNEGITPEIKSSRFEFAGKIGVYLVLFSIAALLSQLVEGGVENSTINFDVSDIFRLNYLSYIGFLAFALLYFVYFLIADKAINRAFKKEDSIQAHLLIYLLISIAGYLIIASNKSLTDASLRSLWSFPIILSILMFKKGKQGIYSFSKLIILVLMFSATAALIISNGSRKREMRQREYLVKKLATNEDPVAEYMFHEISEELKSDSFILASSADFWMKEELIKIHLREKYFNGYWDKYDLQFVACQEQDSIFISNLNVSDNCRAYFQGKIAEITEKTEFQNLFHERSTDGIASYIGIIELGEGDSQINFYVEFRSKPIIKNEGYPELLLGQKEIDRTLNLQDYSFARYYKGKLITSSGEFNYPTSINIKGENFQKTYHREGFTHLVNQNRDGVAVVLSKSDNYLFKNAILFSFLFSLFLLLFFVLSLVFPDFPIHYNFSINSYGSKLQLLLIGVILFVVVPFGTGVAYYINSHYKQLNDRNITEKISSVLTEIDHKIGNEEYIPSDIPDDFQNYLNQILIKFSNVFYTDINLYSTDGQLIATSRSEVFDIGLKGKKMNNVAYYALAKDQKSMFIHNENIGSLSYLSAYVPFRNQENDLLAYLNLPYFAKQYELERDLSSFLLALVNTYIFLIALAIIVSVVFADYLTRPLKLIGSKIRKLKLGSENELIQWEGDDEIGALVEEYNRMVMELAHNVDLLAQSEREGAWREMAKQVAHEIKNPLTPMKLSVQHLKRSAEQNSENIQLQIDKVSKTLIEQIDSLTRIADEFSNFAKMPAARNERFNLSDIIKSSINLYQDENADIKFVESGSSEPIFIRADRDQILRVFNNIIKNALQAIPDDKDGIIEINMTKKPEKVVVSISDNGKGMTKEEMSRIFAPNFTTKSGGMGLGLAMVKNIIEEANGKISFQSTLSEGTVFTIELPLSNQ